MLRFFQILICFAVMFMTTSMYAQSLKVMTYNIRYDTPNDSVNQWGKRTPKVYALIKKYNPDILGVQEALYNQITDLVSNLKDYAYVGVGRDDGKTKGEFSAILYRKDKFTITKEGTFWLSPTPTVAGSKGWDAAITRVATWAVMKDKKSGASFLMLNTHFDHMGKEARRESALLIKKRGAELAGKLPVIVTGDFNCTREEPPYTAIMSKEGLQLLDPAPSPAPGTFCTFKVNSIECRPIDYVFHTSEWKANNYKAITDNDGKYYPSDHLPVMVELSK
ncbi:endonuclease/exonuclease/phosphatase family protein [Chryseolinea sp. T2]|uniref:endonuclease/exonuclease/phosphatase family protein n=1 Tax=Chryseolinea sp. T2 TaxID=3129255 RepID=UPI003078286F